MTVAVPTINEATATQANTREKILAAALDLFVRQGFAATSIKEITDACGITKGAMYNHFSSKEQVLYTIISEATAEGAKLIDEHLAQAPKDPIGQLHAVTYASTLYYTRHRAASFVAAFEYIHLSNELKNDFIRQRVDMRRRIERIIRAGLDQNQLKLPDASASSIKMAAAALVSVAMRVTDIFGPYSNLSDETLADYHAKLAIQMLGGYVR